MSLSKVFFRYRFNHQVGNLRSNFHQAQLGFSMDILGSYASKKKLRYKKGSKMAALSHSKTDCNQCFTKLAQVELVSVFTLRMYMPLDSGETSICLEIQANSEVR